MKDTKKIVFKIDKNRYEISEDKNPMSGSQLRALPPVADDYDLWLRGRGSEDDQIITPEDSVTVENGFHFFTSKSVITPGGNIK